MGQVRGLLNQTARLNPAHALNATQKKRARVIKARRKGRLAVRAARVL